MFNFHHANCFVQIWVQSSHNASGYLTIYGDDSDYGDHFHAKLVTGNTTEVYARTGYLGFLRRSDGVAREPDAAAGEGDSLTANPAPPAPPAPLGPNGGPPGADPAGAPLISSPLIIVSRGSDRRVFSFRSFWESVCACGIG